MAASKNLTPQERSLRARAAAHQSWAQTDDPSKRTQPARDAMLARFEREVDPAGELSDAERRRRAEHARQAHMQRLSLKAAKARRLRAAADEIDAELDAELDSDAQGGDA